MEQEFSNQPRARSRPSENDFVGGSPEPKPRTEESAPGDFWSRKGVIKMEEGSERCTHSTVPPSAMMTLAMELLVSKRGKASKIFRDAKIKTQCSDDEDDSNLPNLWVVPGATSDGEAPIASHLQPVMDNVDFVVPTSPEVPNVVNEENDDTGQSEFDVKGFGLTVADLVGSEDKVFRYSDDEESNVTGPVTSQSQADVIDVKELSKLPLDKVELVGYDTSTTEIDGSIRTQSLDNNSNVINPSSTQQSHSIKRPGSCGVDEPLTNQPITGEETKHVINDANITLNDRPFNGDDQTYHLETQTGLEAQRTGQDTRGISCEGTGTKGISPKECGLDSRGITQKSIFNSSNQTLAHGDSGNDELDRLLLRGMSATDGQISSSAFSRSTSSSSLCSLGSLSSASLHLSSVTSEKVSVASCVSLTPDSMDLCERRCVVRETSLESHTQPPYRESTARPLIIESSSAKGLNLTSRNPSYRYDGCAAGATSATNPPLERNSQLNDVRLKVTGRRSRSASSDHARSSSVASQKSPSRKIICEFSEQLPHSARPVTPGPIISQAVFPDEDNSTVATPVLYLKNHSCKVCGQTTRMPSICCCIKSKPKVPPRTDSRGAVDRLASRNGDSPVYRRSSSSSSQDSQIRVVGKQEEVLLPSRENGKSLNDEPSLMQSYDCDILEGMVTSPCTANDKACDSGTTEREINNDAPEKQLASVTTMSHRNGCRVTLANLNVGKQSGNVTVNQKENEYSSADVMEKVRVHSPMQMAENRGHVTETCTSDLQETIIDREGSGRIRVVGGSRITLVKGIRGSGQTVESSRSSPCKRKIVIMADDVIDKPTSPKGTQATFDSRVLNGDSDSKRRDANCDTIAGLNTFNQVRPIESQVVASRCEETSRSFNTTSPVSKGNTQDLPETRLSTTSSPVEQIVVEPSFVNFEGQQVYKASTPTGKQENSRVNLNFRNKVTVVHRKTELPTEPIAGTKLKTEEHSEMLLSSPTHKTDSPTSKSYTSTVTLSLKPAAQKPKTPTEQKAELSFYPNQSANPAYHKWVHQWSSGDGGTDVISPIREHVKEFNSKNDKPILPIRNNVGTRTRIQSNVEGSRSVHSGNVRSYSTSGYKNGDHTRDGDKGQETKMTSPPAFSTTNDDEFIGVDHAPLKNVKDIRAMFKKGPDYANYAKPRTLSSTSGTKADEKGMRHTSGSQSENDPFDDIAASEHKVAKQVMGMFQGALDIEKELAVFEEERLSQSANQSPVKHSGHVITTTYNTQERRTQPSSVTSSNWSSSGDVSGEGDSPRSDIRTSIAQIKSETATVTSFDESLDQFYDVLNDLTS